MNQFELLPSGPDLPLGFVYRSNFLDEADQFGLLASIAPLPFKEFEFHGFLGRRRVVSYGWKYDFSTQRLEAADDMPDFLKELRVRIAHFAGIDPGSLQQAMISEYSAGAGIGWHRDKGLYGEIIGVSLGAACNFRLRRRQGTKWLRRSILAEPGSAYLLSGSARDEWEHSIPPVADLRYSITFRSLRASSQT